MNLFRDLPLAGWLLIALVASNVITALGVLYIAFGTPNVGVSYGYVDISGPYGGLNVNVSQPVRVQIVDR